MLFPLYWMINVSFTGRAATSARRPLPRSFTLDSYREALGDQLPYLGHQPDRQSRHRRADAARRRTGGVRVGAPVRAGRAALLSFRLIVAQMVPAVVMALGFYQLYSDLGILDTIPGLILADSTLAVPFGVMVLEAFMLGIPRELLQAAESTARPTGGRSGRSCCPSPATPR